MCITYVYYITKLRIVKWNVIEKKIINRRDV